jgi:DNA-binding transcriptional ArsR family regulator
MRDAIAIGLSHESGLRLAIRVARDSMPPMRLAIIDDLAEHPYSTPTDVHKRLGKPRATVDRQLQALRSLHVVAPDEETGDQRTWWHYTLAAGIDPKALLVPEISIKGVCTQMEYLDSDKAGTNGAPRPRTGRNICEVCERALARTDTGMCDFCTVKQQRQAGGVA